MRMRGLVRVIRRLVVVLNDGSSCKRDVSSYASCRSCSTDMVLNPSNHTCLGSSMRLWVLFMEYWYV